MKTPVTEARRHAVTASELLACVARTGERLERLTSEDRLQMVATGQFTRVNRDLEWTVTLAHAHAHALAAIAMALTDGDGP